tara:strand:+ start:6216 stop:7052 length:837 start_codon:yes stop_codon:yes gene_type:complete
MLKNTYKYVSSFEKLLTVKFNHNFYKDNLLKGLAFFADPETNGLLASLGILLRPTENGFTLVSKSDPKFESITYAGALDLVFFFKIPNKYFLNITDIPYTNNQKFIFKNKQDVSNEKLHSNFYVEPDDIKVTEDGGLLGQISLTINSKNQFYGSEAAASVKKELMYSIHFNARQVVFRYNFISSSQGTDFDSFYVTDEQNTFKLKNFKTRTLANGQSVSYILIEEKTLVSESYSKKLYFKKEDDFLSYFSIFLPYPTTNNISYDAKNDTFYSDVFVNI